MILEVKDLVKTFGSREKTVAVDHVSFSLAENECLGIIGESGSGKSTTANIIAGFLKPDSGSIVYEGNELTGRSSRQGRKLREGIQMVFQDPQGSFDPRIKLGKSITEPLRCKKGKEGVLSLEEVMDMVGLKAEYADKYPWEISGGECQRAAIARALISRPSLLICDELTSALDVSVQAQIINLLYDLKKKSSMAFIFISHDLASVSSLCDDVAVMYKGRYLEYGRTMDVISDPGHPYTRDLMNNAVYPGRKPIFENSCSEEAGCCPYRRYCSDLSEDCRRFRMEDVSQAGSYCMCVRDESYRKLLGIS